ncbi:MAG TPA: DNA topoisomerase IV subunit B, partial [Alcanivorax sp.]|nr:DNA topoisomerase IV subunit B [Alcanivorax sp.]
RNTGTILRFWPDAKYFDSPKISVSRLKHLLRAKAVLCPGLLVSLDNQVSGETDTWQFADGLIEYLLESGRGWERVPGEPFNGAMSAETEAVDWAVMWLPEGGELVQESYVNLIPTPQGGTHVNGLRSGLLEAMR